VTLRPAIYRQLVRLGDKPLDPTTRVFIFQLNTSGYRAYVTRSLTRDGSVVYSCCWASPAQSVGVLLNNWFFPCL
jgi:hypothetical protein